MTSRLSSPSNESDLLHLLSYLYTKSSPPDCGLPGRQVIPTYLRKLDKQWRGGWSWQWPMLIAGPSDAGKTLFAYQLVASTLLSCPSPWRVLYFDYKGDFHPESLLKILNVRRNQKARGYLGRLDKISFHSQQSIIFAYQTMAIRMIFRCFLLMTGTLSFLFIEIPLGGMV